MKKQIVLMSLGYLFIFCLAFSSCSSKGFTGKWVPAPAQDKDIMTMDSLNINSDGTFLLKFKEDSKRKDITGTYKIENEKIHLSNPDIKGTLDGNIESDGRLKLAEPERGNSPAYFSRG